MAGKRELPAPPKPTRSKNEAQYNRTKANKIRRLEKEVKRGNLAANKRLEELKNGR